MFHPARSRPAETTITQRGPGAQAGGSDPSLIARAARMPPAAVSLFSTRSGLALRPSPCTLFTPGFGTCPSAGYWAEPGERAKLISLKNLLPTWFTVMQCSREFAVAVKPVDLRNGKVG